MLKSNTKNYPPISPFHFPSFLVAVGVGFGGFGGLRCELVLSGIYLFLSLTHCVNVSWYI